MVHETVAYYLDKLKYFTVRECIVLLRRLGNYHCDRLFVHVFGKGFKWIKVYELEHYFGNVYVADIGHVYFAGGPTTSKQFKGTVLTFAADRCIYVSYEHSVHFVNRAIYYSQGISDVLPSAARGC